MSQGERVQRLESQAQLLRTHARFRTALERYFMRRIRPETEVDDAVQEVFVRLAKRGAVEDAENAAAYIFTTAKNVLIDRARRAKVRHENAHVEFDAETHGDEDFSPEHVLEQEERLALAAQIIEQMPERMRTVFVMRRLEGMRYAEIADTLGVSVSAVEKHMQRAMKFIVTRIDS